MSEFQRKQPVVKAIQFSGTPESGAEVVAWAESIGCAHAEFHPFLADHFRGDPKVYVAHPDPYMRIVVLAHKVEVTITASVDEWMVYESGEFSACGPDIFAATYEAADAPT